MAGDFVRHSSTSSSTHQRIGHLWRHGRHDAGANRLEPRARSGLSLSDSGMMVTIAVLRSMHYPVCMLLSVYEMIGLCGDQMV